MQACFHSIDIGVWIAGSQARLLRLQQTVVEHQSGPCNRVVTLFKERHQVLFVLFEFEDHLSSVALHFVLEPASD
jgi:hypothetical protein